MSIFLERHRPRIMALDGASEGPREIANENSNYALIRQTFINGSSFIDGEEVAHTHRISWTRTIFSLAQEPRQGCLCSQRIYVFFR